MSHIGEDSMDYMEIKFMSQLLETQGKSYQNVVKEGILVDHLLSLKHGLRFIKLFSFISHKENTIVLLRILKLVPHAKEIICSLSYLRKDESLSMTLDREYSGIREEMKNVFIKPGTNKCYVLFPESFHVHKKTSLLLCEIIEELVSSDCKADQIRPVMNELEDIRKILYLLEPFFEHAKHAKHFEYEEPFFFEHEKDNKILSIVAAVMERVICFVYLTSVGKMDEDMLVSLRNISSKLITEETQIMDMYLSLDVYSTENLESHISMSLRLSGWNKRCYLGTELGEALEDHFTSIEHGLQYLVKILKVSKNEDLKLRVLRLIGIMKQKLYLVPRNQNDENLRVTLEQTYGELREKMKNVVIKVGTDDYDTLFPKFLNADKCLFLEEILELGLSKITSSSKADLIAPMMKEIKEFRKKLRSLKPLFDSDSLFRFTRESEEIKVNVAFAAFIDRATCLIYFSLVAKLNEDMFVSLRKNFSLLIEETEIKKMSLDLGIIFVDDFESDIDISISLMKRRQEYQICTKNEAVLEDHIISLKHGIEFLKWLFNIYNFDKDLKRCTISLAGYVKQTLELFTNKQEDSSNMDVNGACAVLREKMKNVIISQIADKYRSHKYYGSCLDKILKAYLRRNYDFLVEKITTLVTSTCKADRIAPLKKELQDLQKKLKIFKPLALYICGISKLRDKEQILRTLLTFLHKATFLIYFTFVGTMDIEMVLSVKSSISVALKETHDVQEIYTLILNQFLSEGDYKVKELYLLENLMIMLQNNGESLCDEKCKLHKVLGDIHSFLVALPPNAILRKLHLLKESFEGILRHSIPIVYSCYLELTEVDIVAEFNCVLDLIKHIKSEALETKLYYFPRVDDLGFLEFLLGYLEDLMKNQEILLKEKIDALHVEVSTLLSVAKSRNLEEVDKNPWNDIMNMAYQAEYIIDLYLVSSPRDLGLISFLSKIIHQLHNIRADVTRDLSHLCKSLPAQDVAAETSEPQVRDNNGIVGLQEETKNNMEDLLKGENKLTVVAITGMAGVGKTTLALTLYNTPSTAHHFDIRAWYVVSQSYQLRALLVSLLDQVNASDKVSNMDDQDLADHFCRSLKERRYLIVLDDIWDTTLWKDLKRCLPDDRNGSRILITTRSRDVGDQIGSKLNELHRLSEENSWQLFQKKILEKERLSTDLLNISKGIVKNCKGLPLSIVIIAGILSGIERTVEKWNQISGSVNSFVLSEPQGNCRAILELSYNHLPCHLRSCFLYLGSFPEDQEISVKRLILLWIGEGFVQDTEIDTAEEVARKYVEDLTVKSLVIPAKNRSLGGVKTFRLHDLLRDFCLGKAKENHFFTFLDDEVLDERNHSLALRDPTRIVMSGLGYMARKIADFSFHSVRSMTCHGKLDTFEIKKRIGSSDMVLLRVLEVDEACSMLSSTHKHPVTLLEEISSLVHLRYLAFHYGPPIVQDSGFTSSINKLQNLQILILVQFAGCQVQDFIWDMVKLRHVHIHKALLAVKSNRLENSSVLLENLKSLSRVQVSYGDSKWLSKLFGLQRLCCLFTTMYDGKEVEGDVKENQSRMLSFNGTLISLKVKNRSGPVQRFISTCQLPKSLQKLTLSYFSLESNDISIIGQTLTHLEVLKIQHCGVPSGYIWNVEGEDFPELKVLKLKDLKICKWTVSEDSFPNLEQLWVNRCDCLDEIPLEFGFLLKLRIISVEECPHSVDNSAREIEELQHQDQNTEMRVHVSQKSIPIY